MKDRALMNYLAMAYVPGFSPLFGQFELYAYIHRPTTYILDYDRVGTMGYLGGISPTWGRCHPMGGGGGGGKSRLYFNIVLIPQNPTMHLCTV